MKISELISYLQTMKERFGDVPVLVRYPYDPAYDYCEVGALSAVKVRRYRKYNFSLYSEDRSGEVVGVLLR